MSRGDAGSAALELSIVAFALVALIAVAPRAGAPASAQLAVDEAAADAARAATLERTPLAAQAGARDAAVAALHRQGVRCMAAEVGVDTNEFRPGGRVHVTLSCRLRFRPFFRLPTDVTVTGRAMEVVDLYRRGEGGA